MFDPASHRDFLGACLGTGIERSKVGDIIVTGEQGCQILCAPALVEHLEAELTQVGGVCVWSGVKLHCCRLPVVYATGTMVLCARTVASSGSPARACVCVIVYVRVCTPWHWCTT